MLNSHKAPSHSCERITDIEDRQVDELRSIVAETRSKIASCDAISADLEVMLSDLQQQRDYAQDLIKETCQSYKALVEKCQVCVVYIVIVYLKFAS
jgi:tripartite motif-containing protein 2/3